MSSFEYYTCGINSTHEWIRGGVFANIGDLGRDKNVSKMDVDSVDGRRPNVNQKSSVVDVDQLKTS